MELINEFRVAVPVAEAWVLLTDLERIAPCMPGAELQEIEGDEYRGIVKVKVGPITAQYKGKASFIERDEAAGKAVLRAEGHDARGQGNANATITADLEADGTGTHVTVTTDLTITGRVAQFGRGVLADVSGKLLTQFVQCLEANVLGEAPPPPPPHPEAETLAVSPPVADAPAAPPAPPRAAATPEAEASGGSVAVETDPPVSSNGATASGPAPDAAEPPTIRRIQSAPAAPVDLFDAAGGSVAKRIAPVAIAAVVLLLLVRHGRRRRHR